MKLAVSNFLSAHKIKGKIACACSGGIDSMAMTLLLKENSDVVALIVNHNLRKEAAAEAKRASEILTKLGIENKILNFRGKKPESNIQEEARKIRYNLLLDYCEKNKIKTLATAHNAEDNAETFLMRLARGSGVDGLSGIAETSKLNDVKLIRPVLSFSRNELKKYLQTNKIKWVEDPTNKTDKYRRNKLRHSLSKIENAELITKRINEAAQNISRTRNFLETETEKAYKSCTSGNKIELLKFQKLHEEIQFRLLNYVIAKLSPLDERPRFESLKRLKSELFLGKTRTLAGLIFRPKQGKIIIDIEKW